MDFQQVFAAALSRGGHYADIYIEHTVLQNVELQDGRVSQAQQSVLHGAGIRVVCGEQTGYAYTMDLSQPSLMHAARFAASIGDGNIRAPHCTVCTDEILPRPDTSEPQQLEGNEAAALLLKIQERACATDPRIVRVKASLSQRTQQIQFLNSLGEEYTDLRPRTSLFVSIVMEQGGQTQMGFASRMMQHGAEMLTDELVDEVTHEAISRTAFLFDATRIDGGEMPVVMAAGASGILLHEAIGHAFEADFIRQGTSIFSDRLGTEICDPSITIVDDGTQEGDAGRLRWDDEGTAGQRTVLVEKGRLVSFMHDRISAKHFGVDPTGNGRRQSFRHTPQPRMRSTYMLAGETPPDDIIRSVRRGILAQTFTNGQVQIGAGDFTFYMKQGYLIEDGRLTQPLRDLNIIGNGPQALRDICLVGNDLKLDHSASMCGKGGQTVPVSQGLPTVLIKKLVVG